MATQPPRHGHAWTSDEEQTLRELAQQNTPTRLMALKLDRTEESIRSKARDLRLSLKPTNQAPYG